MNSALRSVAASLMFLTLAFSPARAQKASVTGSVLVDPTEKPLANAEILLTDLKLSTRSDSSGKFLLNGLPAGKHKLQVRLVGYESFNADITLTATQTLDADYLLKTATTKLDQVNVQADREHPFAAKLAEFNERRSLGIGRFMTADEFEKEDGRPASSLLQAKIPGIKIVQLNGKRLMAAARGKMPVETGATPVIGLKSSSPFNEIPPACYMRIVINGRIEYNNIAGQEPFDIDRINTKDIIGLEFYTVATTPLQYDTMGGKSCGTVIIWTKAG